MQRLFYMYIYIDIFMQHRMLHMVLSNTSTQDVNLANTIREARKKNNKHCINSWHLAIICTYIKIGQYTK